jgi:hypothetical protein
MVGWVKGQPGSIVRACDWSLASFLVSVFDSSFLFLFIVCEWVACSWMDNGRMCVIDCLYVVVVVCD